MIWAEAHRNRALRRASPRALTVFGGRVSDARDTVGTLYHNLATGGTVQSQSPNEWYPTIGCGLNGAQAAL